MEFCSGKPDNPAASVMDYCTGVLIYTWVNVIDAVDSIGVLIDLSPIVNALFGIEQHDV